jgi:hypothetical protein
LNAEIVMNLENIVTYWSKQHRNDRGQWVHPADQAEFDSARHTFNLDYPVSPYVGDILNAPVVILGANAGYDPLITPVEFPDADAISAYVHRVSAPDKSDWSAVAPYYEGVNYGPLIGSGQAVLINACPYRSKKISEEPDNKRLLDQLPSTEFTREWLLSTVIPLAEAGQRLVIAKRPGLWRLPQALRNMNGIEFDPAPISPQITSKPWSAVAEKLGIAF